MSLSHLNSMLLDCCVMTCISVSMPFLSRWLLSLNAKMPNGESYPSYWNIRDVLSPMRQCRLSTELAQAASNGAKLAHIRLVGSVRSNTHVQAIQPLIENVNDPRSNFADVGILITSSSQFIALYIMKIWMQRTLISTVWRTTSNHVRRSSTLVCKEDVTATPTESATIGDSEAKYVGFKPTKRLSNRSACWLDWSH